MLLSVLLSVYNGKTYLRECIHSIIGQKYEDWELILINDGSVDGTQEIIEEFDDPRIRKFTQSNKGLAFSLNRGAKEARGEVLVRQDADDISEPNRLAKIAETFRDSDECILLASNATVVDDRGKTLFERQTAKIKEEAIRQILRIENPFVHGTLAYRAKSFRKWNGYDVNYPTSQDFDFIVRALSQSSLRVIDEPLYKLRLHPESVTSRKSWRQILYLNKFCKTIKTYLGERVPLKSRCLYFTSRFFIFIYFSRLNRKSVYYYQIASILSHQGNKSKSIEFYNNSIKSSYFNMPALVKKYLHN
jgi:glycosyltransferase involved in cell wall biosynthesis